MQDVTVNVPPRLWAHGARIPPKVHVAAAAVLGFFVLAMLLSFGAGVATHAVGTAGTKATAKQEIMHEWAADLAADTKLDDYLVRDDNSWRIDTGAIPGSRDREVAATVNADATDYAGRDGGLQFCYPGSHLDARVADAAGLHRAGPAWATPPSGDQGVWSLHLEDARDGEPVDAWFMPQALSQSSFNACLPD